MRKTIIFMACLCGFFPGPSVRAADPVDGNGDSEIRLYGRGDFDITQSRRASGPPVITSDLWKGSRVGLKGRGYLGAGWAAIVHVESGFGTENGEFLLMQDKVFGRQAYLGLESRLGTVTFGRQYPVSDAVAGIVDIALPGILSPYKSQFYWQFDRLEKALLYSSPAVNGFQARAGYAFGEKAGQPGSSTMTAGILYHKDRLEAGVSLESWETSAFSNSSAVYNFWNLAASYDLGPVLLVAGFSSDDLNLDLSSNSAVVSRTCALGAKIPATAAGQVVILLQAVKPETGKTMEIATIRYTYSLFKGTDLYSQINVASKAAAAAYGVRSELFIGMVFRFDLPLWKRKPV